MQMVLYIHVKFWINQQVIRLFISENGSGIFWMIITGILFCAMTGCVKMLGTSLSASQSGFIRYVFGLIILAPFCLKLDLKDFHVHRQLLPGFQLVQLLFE